MVEVGGKESSVVLVGVDLILSTDSVITTKSKIILILIITNHSLLISYSYSYSYSHSVYDHAPNQTLLKSHPLPPLPPTQPRPSPKTKTNSLLHLLPPLFLPPLPPPSPSLSPPLLVHHHPSFNPLPSPFFYPFPTTANPTSNLRSRVPAFTSEEKEEARVPESAEIEEWEENFGEEMGQGEEVFESLGLGWEERRGEER